MKKALRFLALRWGYFLAQVRVVICLWFGHRQPYAERLRGKHCSRCWELVEPRHPIKLPWRGR
jgi:hypothetical protein